MRIDCHAHIADALTGFWKPLQYGRVRDGGQARQLLPPSFHPPASPPEVLLGYMDDVGVARTFLVQHHMYGDQNAAVLDAIRRWPDRFIGWAYLPGLGQPESPERLEHLLDAGMIGLKVELASARRLRADFRFDGPGERRVWQRLNARHRPLALDINAATADDVTALRALRDEFEETHIIVCHVGGPPRDGWQARALLAQHPRGWIDVSALPALFGSEQEYPYPQAQEVIRWAVETVGAERVMWGSDYPPTLMYGTYRQLLDVVGRHCSFLTEEQKAMLLGGTADRFLQCIH